MVNFLLEFTYTRNELEENFVYMNPQPSSSDPNAGNTYSTIAFAPLYDLLNNLVGTINFNETFNYHDKIVSSNVTINLNKGEYENNESTFYWNFTYITNNNSTTYVPGDVLESNILAYSGRFFASYDGFAKMNISTDPLTRTREVILSFSRTEPSLDTKIVALLENDINPIDTNVKNTLIYYFTNYNSIYKPFNIEILNPDINEFLVYLEKYYQNGCRYFLITSHTAILFGVLEWFNSHPDSVGYSNYAQSTIFTNIPKNIYTLNPSIDSKLDLFSNSCILPYDIIYFVYNSNPTIVTNVDAFNYIKNKCASLGKTFVPIAFNSPSQITQESIDNIMTNVVQGGQNASFITSLLILTNNFYNAFYSTTPQYNYKFYELSVVPVFVNPQSKNYFVNNLFVESLSQANLNTSYLWKVGYQKFGFTNYAATVLNSLSMVYGSENKVIIADQLPSHSDNLYFNYIYKYLENRSVAVYEYILKDNIYQYIPVLIYYGNDEGKTFVSNVPQPEDIPVVIQPIPAPVGPKKKAIVFVDLSSPIAIQSIVDPIYYYTTTTNLFEHLSIINVSNEKQAAIDALNKYYAEGYTVFIGFSTSRSVYDVLDWFDSHPDTIGISIGSSANSLSTIKKNIYRLQPSDQYLIDGINEPLQKTIDEGGKIFYVFSEGEVATNELLLFLQETYGYNNIITYAAKPDSSNLTQNDLYNFFITENNATSIDTIIVYLFVGEQQQIYVNAFTSPLYVPSSQYDITGGSNSKIDITTTTLNGLYNVVSFENITKSELLIQGLKYLKSGFAINILNALYMVTMFVNNYDVLSLASYNSCLQFNEYNDIAFGSIAVYLYQDGIYINKFIYSKDPIYGQLNFTPI